MEDLNKLHLDTVFLNPETHEVFDESGNKIGTLKATEDGAILIGPSPCTGLESITEHLNTGTKVLIISGTPIPSMNDINDLVVPELLITRTEMPSLHESIKIIEKRERKQYNRLRNKFHRKSKW